jgi:hypothetical protein
MKTKREIIEDMMWVEDNKVDCFVDLVEQAMEKYAEQQVKILNKHDVGRSLPTDEMILNKAKDLAISFKDETDDKHASVELTSKDLLWLVEFAKGNVC